jgi:RNA 3'-terminal phosphate cyclase (ATP)
MCGTRHLEQCATSQVLLAAVGVFVDTCCLPLDRMHRITATTSTGCILAGSALGAKGKHASQVGEEAGTHFADNWNLGGCVDEYLQDQLIIFMALAHGVSRIRSGPLTLHTETGIHFSSLLTGAKFTVTAAPKESNSNKEDSYIIECTGVGFVNERLQ